MNKTSFGYEVSLRIFHPSIDPQEITKNLSIVPSYSYMAGSRRVTPKGRELDGLNKETFWRYFMEKKAKGDIGTLPEALWRVNEGLSKRVDFFSYIRSGGGRIEYFIGWFTDFNSGEIFDCGLLKQCAELGIDLAFDVYGSEKDRDTHF